MLDMAIETPLLAGTLKSPLSVVIAWPSKSQHPLFIKQFSTDILFGVSNKLCEDGFFERCSGVTREVSKALVTENKGLQRRPLNKVLPKF